MSTQHADGKSKAFDDLTREDLLLERKRQHADPEEELLANLQGWLASRSPTS